MSRAFVTVVTMVLLAACEFSPPDVQGGEPMTVTFQQDVDGYTGTHDSELNSSSSGSNFGDDEEFVWDRNAALYALLRFDAIFGTNADQIPAGATIISATLTITMIDMTANPAGSVHAVLVPWEEQEVTFDNFGDESGIQSEDHGPELVAAPLTTGANELVLTESVQAWADSPDDNWGWIVIPGSTNGARHHSSESATGSDRPRLTVEYRP